MKSPGSSTCHRQLILRRSELDFLSLALDSWPHVNCVCVNFVLTVCSNCVLTGGQVCSEIGGNTQYIKEGNTRPGGLVMEMDSQVVTWRWQLAEHPFISDMHGGVVVVAPRAPKFQCWRFRFAIRRVGISAEMSSQVGQQKLQQHWNWGCGGNFVL